MLEIWGPTTDILAEEKVSQKLFIYSGGGGGGGGGAALLGEGRIVSWWLLPRPSLSWTTRPSQSGAGISLPPPFCLLAGGHLVLARNQTKGFVAAG